MSRLHTRLLVGLAIVGGALVLHHEVLLGGSVYHMDDAADGYYPAHVAIARAYAHGELPTWERGAWSGWPLAVDPYYNAFYPPQVLYWIFGASQGLGWQIALHTILAAAGMLWLLRRRGASIEAALLGAVSYGFSTFMVDRIRHIIFPQGMAWLPFVLCGVEGWLATRRRRELALIAAASGMMVVCGALPLVPYFAIVIAAYVLPRIKARDAIGVGAAFVVGGLIACAQLVPTMAHVPLSPRQLATDLHFAASYAWPDPRYLGVLLVPDLFGGEDRASWRGVFNHWEMAGYYAGVIPLLLVPFSLRRSKKETIALAAVAVLAILLAFGEKTPVFGFFFRFVPLFGTLRCPTRALVMLIFAVALLGAEGLDRVQLRAPRWLAILFVAAGVLAVLSLNKPLQQPWGHLALVVCAAAAILVSRSRAAPLGIALVTLVDLVSIGRAHVQPRPGDWAEGTDRFHAVEWLRAQPPGDRFIPAAQGPFRLHNVGMTYGMESAGGYDSVSIWRTVNLLYLINNGAPYPYDKLSHDLAAGTLKRFDTPLVDLLNIRWAIAPSPPAPDWIERFSPKPGTPPRARHEAHWDSQLRVYENPHPLPRAFVVYRAETIAADGEQARRMAGLDPRKLAIVDRAPDPAPVGDERPLTPARVIHAERHRLVIEAEPSAAGLLVVSEAHYPGWSVTVDGKPAELLRADYALRGVALPAGKHTVEMRFRSRPTDVGLALSALGLVGLVALSWAGRRRVLQ